MNNQQPQSVQVNELSAEQLQQISSNLYQRCNIFKNGTSFMVDVVRNFVPMHIADRPDFPELVGKMINENEFPEKMYFASVPGYKPEGSTQGTATFGFATFLKNPEVQAHAANLYAKSGDDVTDAVNTIAQAKSIQSVYDAVISYGHLATEIDRREAAIVPEPIVIREEPAYIEEETESV